MRVLVIAFAVRIHMYSFVSSLMNSSLRKLNEEDRHAAPVGKRDLGSPVQTAIYSKEISLKFI